MNPWLPFQIALALTAWFVAVRSVHRAYFLGSWGGNNLARFIARLVRLQRHEDLPKLANALHPCAIEPLLRSDPRVTTLDDLAVTAQEVVASIQVPDRLLRGLATIGTSLGLLAAVATLRRALDLGGAGTMERAAVQAMDSAIVGFMTGFPCWTAIALGRQRLRSAVVEVDRVLDALQGMASADEVVDEPESEK